MMLLVGFFSVFCLGVSGQYQVTRTYTGTACNGALQFITWNSSSAFGIACVPKNCSGNIYASAVTTCEAVPPAIPSDFLGYAHYRGTGSSSCAASTIIAGSGSDGQRCNIQPTPFLRTYRVTSSQPTPQEACAAAGQVAFIHFSGDCTTGTFAGNTVYSTTCSPLPSINNTDYIRGFCSNVPSSATTSTTMAPTAAPSTVPPSVSRALVIMVLSFQPNAVQIGQITDWLAAIAGLPTSSFNVTITASSTASVVISGANAGAAANKIQTTFIEDPTFLSSRTAGLPVVQSVSVTTLSSAALVALSAALLLAVLAMAL